MKQYLTVSILVFIIVGSAYAPDTPDKFKVYVDISCEEKNTKIFIESHIKRELRSLQDVNIISNEILQLNWYRLSLIAVERETDDIAISYVFMKEFEPITELMPYLTKECPKLEDKWFEIALKTTKLNRVFLHGATMGETKDIPEFCKTIVSKFDIKVLERQRAKR